jgi:nucleoside-diphosphate-sugar epimerase
METVLVTGGAGYIGTTLVPHLLEEGYQVRVLDRFYFGRDLLAPLTDEHGSSLELIRGDIREVGDDIFDGIDVSIDLAGISNDPTCELNPELTRAINHRGSVRIGKAAARNGVDLHIFASSCSVYGHGESEGLTENSEPNPLTLYAECKLEAEKELLQIGSETDLVVTAPRFATVFGLSRRMRFDLAINIMTKCAYLDGQIDVYGGGKQWRPFVHVHDVARALERIISADADTVANRRFNVGGDNLNYQIQNLAYTIRDVLPGTEVEKVPTDPDLRTYNVSFERIRSELDFTPNHSVEDGVEEITDALSSGQLDPDERRWVTLDQYKFLEEVENTYAELEMHGSVLY